MIVMSGASNYQSVIKTVYNDIHVFCTHCIHMCIYVYISIYRLRGSSKPLPVAGNGIKSRAVPITYLKDKTSSIFPCRAGYWYLEH